MTMISNFLFNFIDFCVIVSFLTKLLTLGILFPTAIVKAVVLAKLLMLGISPLTSFILPLIVVFVAKLLISGIFSPIFLILELYASFLTTSFFTTLLVYLNQQEQVLIYL